MFSRLKRYLRHLFRKKAKWEGAATAMVADHVELSHAALGEYTNVAHHASIVNSSVGSRTSVGRYTFIRKAEIGKFCSISWRCTIGADGHPVDRISGSAAFLQPRFRIVTEEISKGEVKKTVIGNDVWIGCDVIIVSGVTVGDGAVIGAGAVVTKDVEPYGIYVGVPARKIGSRFDESMTERLESVKWWDYPDSVLQKQAQLFQKPLTEEILSELESAGREQSSKREERA